MGRNLPFTFAANTGDRGVKSLTGSVVYRFAGNIFAYFLDLGICRNRNCGICELNAAGAYISGSDRRTKLKSDSLTKFSKTYKIRLIKVKNT